MSNLFESITTRVDFSHVIQQSNSTKDTCDASARAPLPVSSCHEDSQCSHVDGEKRPVKKDLLSFMSKKPSGASAEQKIPNVVGQVSDCQPDKAPESLHEQSGCQGVKADNSNRTEDVVFQSEDFLSEDVRRFLDEEYGSAYRSQLDVAAVLTTALNSAASNNHGAPPTASVDNETAMGVGEPLPSPPPARVAPAIYSESSSRLRTDAVPQAAESCPDGDEANSDVLSIISAVESFTSASGLDYVPFSKKPRMDVKPSKIEFSVSQSTSSYHKWKSSVSVPEELVRKLPKPAVQPRLPPELAQSHSGPQVLKSSLNINFKKAATTKAELRFNSLATSQDPSQTVVAESSCDSMSACEKPPVKLIIKTLSRESKPQRVVIISCSSSVRRETSHHPNDDSDSDSCGRNSSANAASRTTYSVSLSVPQESSEKESGSGQTTQSGKEHTRSICFCSMQPTVKLTRLDSKTSSVGKEPPNVLASSTWNVLQDMFHSSCEAKQPSGDAITTSTVGSAEQIRRDKLAQGTLNELKRLSDSSGYCAFTNMPNKRESSKIAALYQSTLLTLEKDVRAKPTLTPAEDSQKALASSSRKKSDSARALNKSRLQDGSRNREAFWRKNLAQRRAKFQRLRASRSMKPSSLNRPGRQTASSCHLPELLNPLVAASFDRTTGEPTVDHMGRSSLHIAMGCNDYATLTFVTNVYKRREDLDCKDNEGLTPLFLGCRTGNVKGVEVLLTAGASTSSTCPESGNTPLHEAVLQANLPLVQLLVQFGGDLSTRNKQRLRAMDLKTSSSVSEFLNATFDSYSHTVEDTDIRIIYSTKKLPTVYVLRCPNPPFGVTHCVLQSELCSSLGVSPEYFDVHHSANMNSCILDNSTIASRIINPQQRASFEQSTLASGSSTVLEADGYVISLFNEHTSSHNGISSPALRMSPPRTPSTNPDSSETDEMTDDLSEQDECEIRRDDIKEVNRSLKKLTALNRKACKRTIFNGGKLPSSAHVDHDRMPIERHTEQRILSPGREECSPIRSTLIPCSDAPVGLETRHEDLSTSTALFELNAEENVSSCGTAACSSPGTEAVCIKSEPVDMSEYQDFQAITDKSGRSSTENQYCNIVTSTMPSLHSYAMKVPDADVVSFAHNGREVPRSNEPDCFAVGKDEDQLPAVQIDLDLDKEDSPSSLPANLHTNNRRKVHPLAAASSCRKLPDSDSYGTSLQCHLDTKKTGFSSLSSTSPDTEGPSVFKINILPSYCNIRRPGSSTQTLNSKKVDNFGIASVKSVPSSNILRPSAMLRALNPPMHFREPRPVSPMKVNSPVLGTNTHTASTRTDKSASSGGEPPGTFVRLGNRHSTSSVVCFHEHGSKVFVRGQFKPVRIVVQPTKTASSGAASPQSEQSHSHGALTAPRPLGPANCCAVSADLTSPCRSFGAEPSGGISAMASLPRLTPAPNCSSQPQSSVSMLHGAHASLSPK